MLKKAYILVILSMFVFQNIAHNFSEINSENISFVCNQESDNSKSNESNLSEEQADNEYLFSLDIPGIICNSEVKYFTPLFSKSDAVIKQLVPPPELV